jgi:hypothetical protein
MKGGYIMWFLDLKVGQRFTVPDSEHPRRVYTKIAPVPSPEGKTNAWYQWKFLGTFRTTSYVRFQGHTPVKAK